MLHDHFLQVGAIPCLLGSRQLVVTAARSLRGMLAQLNRVYEADLTGYRA